MAIAFGPMRGGGRSSWPEAVSRSLRAGRVCALAWRGWRGPVVVLGVCGWLLLAGASAFGAELHPFLSSFDGGETPAGSFEAGGVAVDNSAGPSAGAVYVEDPTGSPFPHQVVDKFASAPASGFLCQITGLAGSLGAPLTECDFEDSSRPGTPSGHFGYVGGSGVAVDPATGNVFVVDQGSNVVDEFDSSGKYLSQVTGVSFPRGVAVDRLSGDVYIANAFGEVERFDPVTSVLSTFAVLGGFPGGIAVDNSGGPSAGDVYAVDAGDNVVDKFDPAGTLVAQITTPGAGSFGAVRGVAVDPATGDVYVADQGAGVVDQFDAAGALLSQISGVETGAGAMQPFGVTVSSSGLVYVTDAAHSVVNVFGAGVVVPDVVTGGASKVAPTSATVAGTVNPDGIQLTDCHFDYVDEADYNASAANPYSEGQTAPCVPAAGAIPADSSEHPVNADLTGLTPGTGYHFRLAAANANGANRGGDATFTTVVLPVIDGVSVTELSAGAATLNAKIDPKGFHAEYHFEYGTSTAYGHTVPVPDGDLGSGLGDVAVSQHVSELSEDTVYHWRVVVTGANGTTTGVDHTFIYQKAGSALPDGRAYEMVTPPHKNAALFGDTLGFAAPQVSADGSRVISATIQCLTGAESCNGDQLTVGSPYAFTRGPGGWQVTALSPSAQTFAAVSPMLYSADAGTALFSAGRPGAEDHFYVRRADGSLVDVGPLTPPADGAQGSRTLTYRGSGDGSHVVWESGFTHEHKAPAWPFDETLFAEGLFNESLYQYAGFAATQPSLVAVSGGQDSHDLIGRCGGHMIAVPGGVSEDGRTVFYTVNQCKDGGSGVNKGKAVAVDELFARVGGGEPGARTAAISEPGGLSPAAPDLGCTSEACVKNITDSRRFRAPRLAGASVDGSKAFFLSPQQLMDTASQDSNLSDNAGAGGSGCNVTVGAGGCNLYEYDFSNSAGRELVDVSAGDVSPRVGGVMAVSPDGSHVYFVARGVLTGALNGQGQSAKDGARNLYLFERDAGHPAGTIVFITRLAASDSPEWGRDTGLANVTPDGRFLVFMSHGRLTADDTSLSGAFQVFRYDALTGSLIRLSIGEAGFNDNGNRSSATPCAVELCAEDARIASGRPAQMLGESRGDSSMSDGGSFVFFQSPVALTARALDDVQIATTESGSPVYAQNVYEWHAGHVYLISDGRDLSVTAGPAVSCLPLHTSVCLLGADRSGANVFFSTTDQLVPQDTDTELDYYDARACTAADPCITPPAQQTPCSGLACQASPPAPPALLTAASVRFSGPGNASPGAPAAGKVKVRARTVNGSFLLQVSVPGAGRIAISGAGLRGLRRAVAHPGTYRFAVSLTAKARAALRHRHGRRMKFRVNVTYQPPGGSSSTASLTLSVKG
jgi:DNA-binding beta-propeller fold protein YncE